MFLFHLSFTVGVNYYKRLDIRLFAPLYYLSLYLLQNLICRSFYRFVFRMLFGVYRASFTTALIENNNRFILYLFWRRFVTPPTGFLFIVYCVEKFVLLITFIRHSYSACTIVPTCAHCFVFSLPTIIGLHQDRI